MHVCLAAQVPSPVVEVRAKSPLLKSSSPAASAAAAAPPLTGACTPVENRVLRFAPSPEKPHSTQSPVHEPTKTSGESVCAMETSPAPSVRESPNLKVSPCEVSDIKLFAIP